MESFRLLVGAPKYDFEVGSPGRRMVDETMMMRIVCLVRGLATVTSKGQSMSKTFGL